MNNRGEVLKTVLLIVCAVILLALFFCGGLALGGKGFGNGGTGDGTLNLASVDGNDKKVEENKTIPEETKDESDDPLEYSIIINADAITTSDDVTIKGEDELRTYIRERAKDDTKFVLVDDHAIEGTYRMAQELLKEESVVYTEERK